MSNWCHQMYREILDWYHLMENLYKVGGSNQRLKRAKNFLWQGLVNDAIAVFDDLKKKQAKNIFVSSYDMQKIVEKTFKLPNWLHPNGKFQVIEYLLNFYFVSKWSKTKKI